MGTPQLNIKDAETSRLVRELIELTGETRTDAVRKAVRERLEREKAGRENAAARTAAEKRREFEETWAAIQEITSRVAAQRHGESMTIEDLYDENGMPK